MATLAVSRSTHAAALYLVITIVMTWPIAAGLARDLPGDLGDPAFVSGVLAWGSDHWLALFSGHLGAASQFWDAPIFFPERIATAYSEHFAVHSLLTLPVYFVTRNPILCYNLWFLATFCVSALGMYLLVRDLTGRPGAAFVAGLAFGFAPYRISTLAHLQVLSTLWMPLVLLGIRRYLATRNSDALVAAGAALWAQNLSSGYYMIFFGPFAALYALVEMATRGLMRDLRAWRDLSITAIVALAATLPFAAPYLTRGGTSQRTLTEVQAFSADLLGWLTASAFLNVWGGLQTFFKFEGSLFPGVTVVLAALAGLWAGWRSLRSHDAAHQGLRVAAIFGTLTLIVSFWLSLGPEIQLATHTIHFPALYRYAWEYLPGFSAARVPARFAMLTVLALAVLAGCGLMVLDRDRRRWMLVGCALVILAEGSAFPLPVNGTWSSAPGEFRPPEGQLHVLADAPMIYRALAQLDPRAVIVHFPFGLPEREIQYGYYASLTHRRILNGYSGSVPVTYRMWLPALQNAVGDPQVAAALLASERVTHAVVHTSAWYDNSGLRLVESLERGGWRRLGSYDGAYLLAK
jgi:hypothetical protein